MHNFSDLYNNYIFEGEDSEKKPTSIWGFIGAFFRKPENKNTGQDKVQDAMARLFEEKQKKIEEMRKKLLDSKENAFIAKLEAKQALQLGQMDLKNKRKIEANNLLKDKLKKQAAYYKKTNIVLSEREMNNAMAYMETQYKDVNSNMEELPEEKAKRLAYSCAFNSVTGEFRKPADIQKIMDAVTSGNTSEFQTLGIDEDTQGYFEELSKLSETHKDDVKKAMESGVLGDILDNVAEREATITTNEKLIKEKESQKAKREEVKAALSEYENAKKTLDENKEAQENAKSAATEFRSSGLGEKALTETDLGDGKKGFTIKSVKPEDIEDKDLNGVIRKCITAAQSGIDGNDDKAAEKYREELEKQLRNNNIRLSGELIDNITTNIKPSAPPTDIEKFDIAASSLHGDKKPGEINELLNGIKKSVAEKVNSDAAKLKNDYDTATSKVVKANEAIDDIKANIETQAGKKDNNDQLVNPGFAGLKEAIASDTTENFKNENNRMIDELGEEAKACKGKIDAINAKNEAAKSYAREMQKASENMKTDPDLQAAASKHDDLVPGEEYKKNENGEMERGYYDEKNNWQARPDFDGDNKNTVEMEDYQKKCKAAMMTKKPGKVDITKKDDKYTVKITNSKGEEITLEDQTAEQAGKYEALKKSYRGAWKIEQEKQIKDVAEKLKDADPEKIRDMCDPDSENYDTSVASVVNTMNSEDKDKKKQLKDEFTYAVEFGQKYDLEKAVSDVYKDEDNYDKDTDTNYEKDEKYGEDDDEEDNYDGEGEEDLKNAKGDIGNAEDFKDTDGKTIKNPFKIWKRRKKENGNGKTKNYYNKENDSISAEEFKKRVDRFKKRLEAKKKRDKGAGNKTNESLKNYLLRILVN